MNAPDFLSSSIAEALGWTLVHSLWQGLIITGIVALLLKIIPSRASNYRYTIALAGLLILVIAIGITFTKLYTTESIPTAIHTLTLTQDYNYHIANQTHGGLLLTIRQFMDANMQWFIVCWFAGAIFFLLRVAGGSIYVSMLRRDSLYMAEEWNARVQTLAAQLKIQRPIALAQSARVHAPVVLGYIKPLIIIPTGMLSGLSADQLEAIFLHELIHIKRHDYLVNLFQMFMEAFLFFNPFVWILSTIIRNEREHCCDDAVVTCTGNAKLYATALVQLEETRLSQAGIALSLADNKNLLLKRIKRLMEKSAKNYSGRDRIIPVALLVVGLMCASWLTMSRSEKATIQNIADDEKQLQSDTIIKNKNKSASYSRKVITTTDENGNTHEEVVESREGDEDILAPLAPMDVTVDVPSIPAFPDFPAFPTMMNIDLLLDSIPPVPAAPAWNDHQWEEAAQEFERTFKEKFSEFYKTHEVDFEKMMEELKSKYDDKHLDELRAKVDEIDLSHKMAAVEKEMAVREEAMAAMEKAMAIQEESMKRWEKEHEQQMQRIELKLKTQEENMKKFEAELSKELVKDGYIKTDEKIREINWSDDGSIRINGKEIKGSDKSKYQKLHNKYMGGEGNFNYINED
ncbi:M56 family metallopeptidase [Ohtaekwangia kribbensis]|uniref:M56 family metallopeptidase n=1 Tax=Ohtaekwangia kribbensis TaxID=688913 RepID=A0ABW3K5K8_9BACT